MIQKLFPNKENKTDVIISKIKQNYLDKITENKKSEKPVGWFWVPLSKQTKKLKFFDIAANLADQ